MSDMTEATDGNGWVRDIPELWAKRSLTPEGEAEWRVSDLAAWVVQNYPDIVRQSLADQAAKDEGVK